MKYGKIYNFFITLLLIPLWIGLLTDFIKEYPWLQYTSIGLTTLLVLVLVVRNVYELVVIIDPYYKCRRRKIDTIVFRARKKLQKIIVRTNNVSVLEHAFNKLSEISPPEVYSGILNELAKKVRDSDKRETLISRAKQTGGIYETQKS